MNATMQDAMEAVQRMVGKARAENLQRVVDTIQDGLRALRARESNLSAILEHAKKNPSILETARWSAALAMGACASEVRSLADRLSSLESEEVACHAKIEGVERVDDILNG